MKFASPPLNLTNTFHKNFFETNYIKLKFSKFEKTILVSLLCFRKITNTDVPFLILEIIFEMVRNNSTIFNFSLPVSLVKKNGNQMEVTLDYYNTSGWLYIRTHDPYGRYAFVSRVLGSFVIGQRGMKFETFIDKDIMYAKAIGDEMRKYFLN